MDQGPKGPPRAEAEGQPSIKALPLKQCRRASPSTRARERNGGLRRSPPKGLQKGGHGATKRYSPRRPVATAEKVGPGGTPSKKAWYLALDVDPSTRAQATPSGATTQHKPEGAP